MGNLKNYWSTMLSTLNIDFTIENLLSEVSVSEKPLVLGFMNAHAFNCLIDVPDFFESINNLDVILRDGIGVAILLKLQGREIGENLNGSDLIPEILNHYKDKRVAILGTREPYLGQAVEAISKRHQVKIVVVENGFEADQHYLELMNKVRADIILLAMGMPKQEKVAILLKENLAYPALVVCGGAVVDFYAGRFKRAPAWVQSAGIEWLYRFCQEPMRLFRRYAIGNIIFLSRALVYTMSRR